MMGVVVIVNGYTNPDAESLQRLLHKHGGDLEKYETSRITHIIAEHLSYAKAKIYKEQKRPKPVCHPKWIVDCVNAQKLLPYGDYLIDEVRDKENGTTKSMKEYFSSSSTAAVSKTKTKSSKPKTVAVTPKELSSSEKSCPTSSLPERHDYRSPTNKTKINDPRSTKLIEQSTSVNEKGKHDNHQSTDYSSSSCSSSLDLMDEFACDNHDLQNKRDPTDDGMTTRKSYQEERPTIRQGKAGSAYKSNDQHGIDGENEKLILQQHSISGKTDDKYINGRLRTTGTDPNFLDTFFKNSRLSFIGSYKQRAKESPTKSCKSSAQDETQQFERFVMHCDLDSFFASVVLRNYPEYKNKPVAISHFGKNAGDHHEDQPKKNSSSECATCNYEARKFGIKKGMFLGRAKELCPNLIVLPYDFAGYEEVSEQVALILQNVAEDFDGTVEQVSCDEFYLELFVPKILGNDMVYHRVGDVANDIRKSILATTRCSATVGVARNKFLAKLATDRVKPNGHLVVRDHKGLLENLKLKDLHGIGYRLERKLTAEGLISIEDIWALGASAETELSRILGPGLGKKIFAFTIGEDDRPVKEAERKTIGAEVRALIQTCGVHFSETLPGNVLT